MAKSKTKFDLLMEAAEVEVWRIGLEEHGGKISALADDYGMPYARVRNRLKSLDLLDEAKTVRRAARSSD